MVHPRKFIRHYLGIAFAQYLARGILVARGLVAAAFLGPHGYGGWNALNLIYDYGTYASAGALQGLDLKLPAAVAEGNLERARRLMAGAWSVVLGGGALFGVALLIYLASGGAGFSALPGRGLPVLMLAAALLQLAFEYLATSLRALGRFHAVSVAHGVQAVVGGGLGVALVWRFGMWGLVWGWIAGSVAALTVMRRAAPEIPLVPWGTAVGVSLVRAGLPIFGFLASTLMLRSAGRLALVGFGQPEALGLYSLGLMAAGLIHYLPEAAAYVLFPRIAAVSHGKGDRQRTYAEALKAHRALALVLPLFVGLGMVWAGPVVARLLPDYRDGVPALRLLAIGAVMLSAATVPAYFLLAAVRPGMMVGIGLSAAVFNAGVVLTVASGDPRPDRVAAATVVGYAMFALAVIARAGRVWFDRAGERVWLVLASLVPGAWAGALALVACSVGPDDSWTVALSRSAAVVLGYAPVVAWLAPGIGLRGLAREWLAARAAVASPP